MKAINDVYRELAAPFPDQAIGFMPVATTKSAPRRGKPNPYVRREAILDRLDAAAGPGGWSLTLERIGAGAYLARLEVLGVIREAVGEAPGGDDEEGRRPEKSAEKHGETNALKRAAAMFGVGRYLKACDLPYVELEQRGRAWVIPDGARPKLLALVRAAAPSPALVSVAAPTATTAPVVLVDREQLAAINAELERLAWMESKTRGVIAARYGAGAAVGALSREDAADFLGFLEGQGRRARA